MWLLHGNKYFIVSVISHKVIGSDKTSCGPYGLAPTTAGPQEKSISIFGDHVENWVSTIVSTPPRAPSRVQRAGKQARYCRAYTDSGLIEECLGDMKRYSSGSQIFSVT
jgi:hypothetical protein